MADDRSGLLMETLAEMTASSLERAALDPREFMLVRLAALVATDAPTSSYLFTIPVAAEAGLTLDDAQAVLITVAPIVGAPRVMAAVGKIAEAFGLALELAEVPPED